MKTISYKFPDLAYKMYLWNKPMCGACQLSHLIVTKARPLYNELWLGSSRSMVIEEPLRRLYNRAGATYE